MKLDARFSDPSAVATPWDDTEQVLREAQLFWITTVRTDGRPHVTPLVAIWQDEALYFSTGPSEQKALNLEANAHVALTTGCNTWEYGLDVVVEGEAVRVTDENVLTTLAAAWRRKWDGSWRYDVRDGAFFHDHGGTAFVFMVRPAKIIAFAKGTFAQTRYRP